MDIIFQTSECPRFSQQQQHRQQQKTWSETMRPYVWDLVQTMNQSYVQLVQAACDTYLKHRHFVLVYA